MSGKGRLADKVLETRVQSVIQGGARTAPADVAAALRKQFASLYQRRPEVRPPTHSALRGP